MTVTQLAAGIGGFCAFCVGIALFIKTVGGPVARFLQRVITDPIAEQIEAMASYVGHHLGPNGDTQPLHEQVKAISRRQEQDREALEQMQAELTAVRQDLEAEKADLRAEVTALVVAQLLDRLPHRDTPPEVT